MRRYALGAVMAAWYVAAATATATATATDRLPHRYRQPPDPAASSDHLGATAHREHGPSPDAGLDARRTSSVPVVGPHGAAPTSKAVFAHYMLCFAAFGGFGNRTGYQREMALAQGSGVDGFAIEYLGYVHAWPRFRAPSRTLYPSPRNPCAGRCALLLKVVLSTSSFD